MNNNKTLGGLWTCFRLQIPNKIQVNCCPKTKHLRHRIHRKPGRISPGYGSNLPARHCSLLSTTWKPTISILLPSKAFNSCRSKSTRSLSVVLGLELRYRPLRSRFMNFVTRTTTYLAKLMSITGFPVLRPKTVGDSVRPPEQLREIQSFRWSGPGMNIEHDNRGHISEIERRSSPTQACEEPPDDGPMCSFWDENTIASATIRARELSDQQLLYGQISPKLRALMFWINSGQASTDGGWKQDIPVRYNRNVFPNFSTGMGRRWQITLERWLQLHSDWLPCGWWCRTGAWEIAGYATVVQCIPLRLNHKAAAVFSSCSTSLDRFAYLDSWMHFLCKEGSKERSHETQYLLHNPRVCDNRKEPGCPQNCLDQLTFSSVEIPQTQEENLQSLRGPLVRFEYSWRVGSFRKCPTIFDNLRGFFFEARRREMTAWDVTTRHRSVSESKPWPE